MRNNGDGNNNGNADKEDMAQAVWDRWEFSFDHLNGGTKAKVDEDMVDAYALARMAIVEYQLRAGELLLSDLEHDKERQVFTRTTKVMPTSWLGREYTWRSAFDVS